MAYTKTVWTDRDVEHPNRYKDQNNNQLILTRDEGTVTEAGTFLNSTVMNNIEDGIEALDTAVSTLELDKISNDGWSSANETWAYSSVDDPTGVITISGDKTTKYSVGMRIKFTNATNVIYGIITAISYSSPNTLVTFLHEIDPTDSLALYLMANSTITANYYSSMKAPYGFPMSLDKWTVSFITSGGTQDNPNTATYYNLGSTALTLPIGNWTMLYNITFRINNGATTTDRILAAYISDSASSLSSSNRIVNGGFVGNYYFDSNASGSLMYSVTSKTVKYLIFITTNIAASGSSISLNANGFLKATCAYL